jgi:hypothetical protein
LLADDGILKVTFAGLLSPDQYVELTEATASTTTVASLEKGLLNLAQKWGIATVTEIVSQKHWPSS